MIIPDIQNLIGLTSTAANKKAENIYIYIHYTNAVCTYNFKKNI